MTQPWLRAPDLDFARVRDELGLTADFPAEAMTEAERATAAEQGRIQRERFLTPGTGYQPGNAQMFNNGNN